MLRSIYIYVALCGLSILNTASSKAFHSDPDLRIIGGHEADPHSAPFMVHLTTMKLNKTTKQFQLFNCGGTLINERTVLTAKHCVENKELNGEPANGTILKFGKHNQFRREPGEITLFSTNYIRHSTADIALIKLDTPLQKSSTVGYVKLPTRLHGPSYHAGEIGTAYGWGRITDEPKIIGPLMTGNFTVMYLLVCAAEYRKFGHREVTYYEICTSGDGVLGTCKGDSGGPLLINGVQVGVTSRGHPKCQQGGPSIYVNLSWYHQWIEEKAAL